MRRWVAIVTVLCASYFAVPATARRGETIQPGMMIRLAESTGGCTANFIYDGLGPMAGRTFIGGASHCFTTQPLGTIIVDQHRVPFGRLVAKTWPLRTVRDDWALIQIFPDRLADVDPSVRGNPKAPTGVADVKDVAIGDEVRVSGWGSFMYLYPDLQRTAPAG